MRERAVETRRRPEAWLDSSAMTQSLKPCPICRKGVARGDSYYPFCSERCQVIDLGNWASEKYVAHSPLTEADEQLDAQSPSDSPVGSPSDSHDE